MSYVTATADVSDKPMSAAEGQALKVPACSLSGGFVSIDSHLSALDPRVGQSGCRLRRGSDENEFAE